MTLRRLQRLALAAILVAGSAALAPVANAAEGDPTPSATPSAAVGTSVSTSTGAARPGTSIIVYGAGWPARVTIQASTCGNNAINGAADCTAEGAGATVTDQQGNFRVDLPVGKPPKPCPCVIHVVSPDTTAKVDQPFVVTGHPTGPLVQSNSTRTLTADARLTGAGPITAWLGGAAERTLVLTVKNTGTTQLTDPGLTLTIGKGSDPTALLATPDIGTVQPGQTLVYELPVKFKAPAFGQYRVKAYFSDLDTPVSTTASTSSYPWVLIVLLWLLLQPILLGLYKRRPVAGGDEDPLAKGPGSPSPVPAGAYSSQDDPFFGGPGVPVGATAAVGAAAYAASQHDPNAYAAYGVPAGAATAIVPRAASALVPNYRPVFGVTDLRAYLGPAGPAAPTVAPRIVLGGIVPAAAPAYDPYQQAYDANGYPANGSTTNGYDANGYPTSGYDANGYPISAAPQG